MHICICRYACSFTYVNFCNPINERGKQNFKQTTRMNINDTTSVIISSTATHVRDGQIKCIYYFLLRRHFIINDIILNINYTNPYTFFQAIIIPHKLYHAWF